MPRLLIFAGAVTIFFVVSIIGARLIGKWTRSTAAAILESGACEQPCWHQIEVGRTTLDQAARLIRADPLLIATTDDSPTGFKCDIGWHTPLLPTWRGCLKIAAPDSIIDQINVFPDGDLSLGEALSVFGTPIAVTLCYWGQGYGPSQLSAAMYMPGNVEIIVFNTSTVGKVKIRPEMRILAMLYRYSSSQPQYPPAAVRWSGFREVTMQRQSC